MTMIEEKLLLKNGAVLRNRIVKSAMSEALADEFNNPDDALISLFARWGESGAAMLITGNVQICRRHLEHAGNVVLDDETDLAKMRQWAAAGKSGGAKFLLQLAHPGRQTLSMLNPHPLSISDVPLTISGHGKPCAMDEAHLDEIIAKFAHAAALACEVGFDGVEIHAAHGWLLSSSLSPRINNRRDRWGGSLENRARLLREVVRAARKETGDDFIIAVKLNASDFQKGGFAPEDAAAVAVFMQKDGADFLEISGGNYESPVAYRHASRLVSREGYFLEYARDIKAAAGIPLMVTGGFRSASVMNDALADGADLIGMARPFIMDPSFPVKLLQKEIDSAPAAERDFPSPEELPRVAGLNWFCHQLALVAKNGAADLSLPVTEGNDRYLAEMKEMSERYLRARGE